MQNPLVATVFSQDHTKRFYLKLLRSSRTSEAVILPYLAQFDSPDNHAIRPLGIRRCDEGTLVLLPDAGITIREHNSLASRLLSVARQFFRGVAFLHEHGVAHCDLKTSNVVIDGKGYVTIIDFDLAVRDVDSLDGFTGTDGWTAPEVGKGPKYSPMLADVWSAGKVIYSVCWFHAKSEDYKFLLNLTKTMMDKIPDKRPSMKDVVESLDKYLQTRSSDTLGTIREKEVNNVP